MWFVIIEVTNGTDLIGGENAFDRELENVGDNANVPIIHRAIRVN